LACSVNACGAVVCRSCQTLDGMNTSLAPPADSWLSLVETSETVLGPSRGNVPDICGFRIAYVHLSPSSLSLFGSVTGMPPEAESNGERAGVRKFNLALEISVRKLVHLSGQPELDPEHDDSMHSFELARPVALRIEKTTELVYPDAQFQLLRIDGVSTHLSFEVLAEFVHAYGGKHAKKRFAGGLYTRD